MSDDNDQIILSGRYPMLALNKLKSLREKSTLCDVTLKIGDTQIPAHKVILAASSPYFEFMFTGKVKESIKDCIEINGLCPKAFLALIDFIYSGYLMANEATVADLLKVADFLKITSAKEECLNYMQKHITVLNCVMVRNIARKYFFVELEKKVNNFISTNFLDVIKTEGFLELSLDQLKDFITEDSIFCHDTIGKQAISSWIEFKKSSREEFKNDLIKVLGQYIANQTQRGLNFYNILRQKRIYLFNKGSNEVYAFDLNSSDRHCVRNRPTFDIIKPLLHNNSICLISTNSNECAVYDLAEEEWSVSTMPFTNSYSGACSNQNRIYLTTSQNSRATFSYDVDKNALFTEPLLIRQRTSPGVTINENCMFVCGGGNPTAEYRDLRTKYWRSVSNLPGGTENVSATSLNNMIYCTSSPGGDFYQYDTRKGKWIKKAAVPRLFTLGCSEEVVYACNGEQIFEYESNGDKWKTLGSTNSFSEFVCVYPE